MMQSDASLLDAVSKGEYARAVSLLENGASLSATDKFGYTPLNKACLKSHSDICLLLIEKGAELDGPAQDGRAPLHLACQNGLSDVCLALIKTRAALDATFKLGEAPLKIALKNGLEGVCMALVDAGASLDEIAPARKAKLLGWSFNAGRYDVALVLLENGAPLEGISALDALKAAQAALEQPPLGIDLPCIDALLMCASAGGRALPAEADGWLTAAREAQAEAQEGSACSFYFVDADRIRHAGANELLRFPTLQELLADHPDWCSRQVVSMEVACRGTLSATHCACSHRWDAPEMPDPNSVQLERVQAFLRDDARGIKVQKLWFDYTCMYQGKRTAAQKREFKAMLSNINILFLGIMVLVLIDRTYLGRFWTQFEGWLSMQRASVHGLISAPKEERRCVIQCVHDAPKGLRQALVDEWSNVTADLAHAKLSQPDVSVTNQSDKQEQLRKIKMLDGLAREMACRLSLAPPQAAAAATSKVVPDAETTVEVLRCEIDCLKASLEEMERMLAEKEAESAALQARLTREADQKWSREHVRRADLMALDMALSRASDQAIAEDAPDLVMRTAQLLSASRDDHFLPLK